MELIECFEVEDNSTHFKPYIVEYIYFFKCYFFVLQFNPGSFRGSVNKTKIQCIFIAAGLNSNTRAANTNSYLFFFTGNFTNGESDAVIEILKENAISDKIKTFSLFPFPQALWGLPSHE